MNSRLLSRMEELRGGKVRAESLGAWKKVKLREVLHERKTYSQKGEGYSHVTLSTKGISPKTERYDRDHLVKDEEKAYKITHKGDICYNPANLKFGVICENTFGDAIFSPIYVTFEVKEGVCREFLANYLMRWDFINAVRKYEEGTVYERMAVKPEDFLRYEIFLPPIEEQRKIAAILTAQDKVIELKERLLAEKQRQKAYLMQQLLTGKKRLPGFSGAWRTERLGKLFLERKETNCEGLEMLAITGTQGIIPRKELDLKDNSSDDKSKYLKVCVGDIGYNTMRMWQGNSAYSNYEGIVSPAYTILKPSASVDAKYFAYLFKMPEIIFLFYRFSQGLVDDTRNLKYENFKKIKVFYPPEKKEQTAITEVLSATDCEIDLLRRDVEQEKQRKKALMHLLLTGIVRVTP